MTSRSPSSTGASSRVALPRGGRHDRRASASTASTARLILPSGGAGSAAPCSKRTSAAHRELAATDASTRTRRSSARGAASASRGDVALLESAGFEHGPLVLRDGPAGSRGRRRTSRCRPASRSARSTARWRGTSGTPTSRRSRTTGAASTTRRSTSSAGSTTRSIDLSIWVVAFDGDEVAGGVINSIDPEQNAALGLPTRLAAERLHATPMAPPWPRNAP